MIFGRPSVGLARKGARARTAYSRYNESAMRYRKLRIAWSVFWGLACVVLVVLWVRSYSGTDMVEFVRVDDRPSVVRIRTLSAFSTRGRIGIGDRTLSIGENPVSIAKKLGVNYDDLVKLNKIDDPKKLKIGQKLRVPMKRPQNGHTDNA